MPSSHEGAEPISISGVTGGSQQLSLLEAEVSLTGNEWQKHPIVTGPEAPCILGIDYLRRGYFKDPKGYRWAFGIAALEAEEIEPLSSLPSLSEDPSVVGLLRVEEQQVPIATTAVHRRQYRTNRDSLVPIHKLICQLEGQGVISRTHSPFNSPIWPVWKSNGEWRLTVDYRGLNEVTLPMSAAVPDMLELQYELESKAAKCRGEWPYLESLAESTRGQPLGFWSRGYRGSKAPYTPMEKEILATYEGVRAASEVIGSEAQLLLAPRLPVLGWMFKERAPSTHHATDVTWSKWAQIGSPSHPGILEVITDWPEGKDFGMSPEEEVTHAEEAPLYKRNHTPSSLMGPVASWESIGGGRPLYGVLHDESQKLLKEKGNQASLQR
ncbi:hypothetical protein GRJ2_003459100 [Grus japonensis]|uniref:Reverse transcriptase/retrotransposon-derived protein RNase H-like domain-containing protein n=1 Tax=Grus japonensis TaxID=30415 RepID=A0ABC9YKA0_GRUJA